MDLKNNKFYSPFLSTVSLSCDIIFLRNFGSGTPILPKFSIMDKSSFKVSHIVVNMPKAAIAAISTPNCDEIIASS